MAINKGYPEGYDPVPGFGPIGTNLQGQGRHLTGNSGRIGDLAYGLLNNNPIMMFANMVKGQYDKAGAWTDASFDTVDKQIGDLGTWFKRESSTPFQETEMGASALQQLRKVLSDSLISGNNNAVMSGATQEAKLAGRGEATEQYSDALSKLVGLGTNRKDQLARDYQYRMGQWLQSRLGLQQGQAMNHSTAAMNLLQIPGQVVNTGMSLASLAGGLG